MISSATCTEYIDRYLYGLNWARTKEEMHKATYYKYVTRGGEDLLDLNRSLILNENIWIYGEMEIHFNNDEIFINGDYKNNMYEEYKEAIDYPMLKELMVELYDEFERVGCPIKEKSANILHEEYSEKPPTCIIGC